MDKLFLPKGAVIKGERISLSHEGDIQIENDLVPLSIKSHSGGIVFIPESQVVNCSHLIAEKGQILVHAEGMNAELISGDTVSMEISDLQVAQAIQAKGKAEITGNSLKTADVIAGDLELSLKGDLVADTIEVHGELVLCARSLKVNQIKAHKISFEIQNKLEVEHLSAKEDVYVASGNISVKYLDCDSFSAAPRVTGIILVATPEHVKAEGVRGFIRPQEFQVFSNTDSFLQIPSGPSEKKSVDLDDSQDIESSPVMDDKPENMAHSPEILSAEPSAREEVSTPQFETLDVEELETREMPEEEPTSEIEDISIESFDEPADPASIDEQDPELPEQPEIEEDPENDVLSEDHSLDELSMETLNIDDDDLDDDMLDEQFSMDTVSEESSISLDIEQVEEELDSSFATNLDNLSDISEEQELSMDSIELGDFEETNDNWELDHIDETPEAFPLQEGGGDLPDADDDFNTTELEFNREDNNASEAGNSSEEDSDDLPAFSKTDPGVHQEDLDIVDLSFGPNTFTSDDLSGGEDGDPDGPFALNEDLPEETFTEDDLVDRLGTLIGEVKNCFPDDNYPKFISQIEVYLNEKRFKILRKKRNREAVISSFDRLDNPKISELARTFYTELSNYFHDEF